MPDLEESGISTELGISGDKRRLPLVVEMALFRIVQEALNNVNRHAHASHVMIGVEFVDGRVKVVVRDDGKGFELLGSPGALPMPANSASWASRSERYFCAGTSRCNRA